MIAPQTLAQKLVARAAGKTDVKPGEFVTCKVDLAMFHDSSGPRRLAPRLAQLNAHIWDKRRVVLVTDHYVPASDAESRAIVQFTRDWARTQALPHVYDSVGICHVVLPNQGHLRPGLFCVGGDSHSPTGGAFGAYMFGIGATEMLGVCVTGEIWLQVPHTILLDWQGKLAERVVAKDMMLALLGQLGMEGGRYQAVEFAGEAVRALSMQERMTLCNMSAELGAQTGLVAPDATTRTWLDAHPAPTNTPHDERAFDDAHWQTDVDAPLLAHHIFNAATLAPQVACPHSPANAVAAASEVNAPLDIAYIGACTGAKLDDLRMAASVLKGQRARAQLLVAPASQADQAQAVAEGIMQTLQDAGATILPNACGACAGYGAHRFGEHARVISTTARNFKGRMGAASSQVWLASPYTVAASAIAGRIIDPREIA